MNMVLLMGVAAVSAAVLIVAALMLLRAQGSTAAVEARYEAARGQWTAPETVKRKSTQGLGLALQRGVMELGRAVMQSGVLPGRTRAELQLTLQAAGFRGPNALPQFIGSKLALLFGLPLGTYIMVVRGDYQMMTGAVMVIGSAVFGLVAPDMIIQKMRAATLKKIERGLSDALDLMVICAQAGLSLTPAMARVASELRAVHPAMCEELSLTVRELEMMSDSAQALTNLGTRTGLDSLIRLTSTLVQTLQYGTPLTEALRTLSNDMRVAALTMYEERAARLPVMLTMPMILFILPTVFMIVGGPAAIQIGRSLNN